MAIKWANFVATCLDSYEQLQPRYVEKLLTPDIPNGPCSMFWIRDVLNIESNCWNCRDHFAQFQLVQHRRLPRCIEAHHHDPVLLTPKQPFCKTYYFVKRRKKAHVLQVVIRKAKIKRRTTNTIDQWFLSSTPKKNCELNIFFPPLSLSLELSVFDHGTKYTPTCLHIFFPSPNHAFFQAFI
jgi:hypothetical protein